MAYEYQVVKGVNGEWHVYAKGDHYREFSKRIGTRSSELEACKLALNLANSDLFLWDYEAHGDRLARESALAVC